jgi:hypothetical protein
MHMHLKGLLKVADDKDDDTEDDDTEDDDTEDDDTDDPALQGDDDNE